MQIREIMSKDVHLVDQSTTIRDCARQMRDDDVGALPVGDNDRLIGMVTDRDIAVRGVAEAKSLDSTVREVMSEGILTCTEDDDIEDAARHMAEHKVRRIPVLDRDKRLCGMLSVADLAKAGIKGAEFQAYREIAQPSGSPRQM